MEAIAGKMSRYFFFIILVFFFAISNAWGTSFTQGYIETDWNSLTFYNTSTHEDVTHLIDISLTSLRIDWKTPPDNGGWNYATAEFEFSVMDQMMLNAGINIDYQVNMAADQPESAHTELMARMELNNLVSRQSYANESALNRQHANEFALDWHLFDNGDDHELFIDDYATIYAGSHFNPGDKGRLVLTLQSFSDIVQPSVSVPEPAIAFLYITFLLVFIVMKKNIIKHA